MKANQVLYIQTHNGLLPIMTSDGMLHRTNNLVEWCDLDVDVLDNVGCMSITNVTCINLCAWHDNTGMNSMCLHRYVRRNVRQIIKIRVVRRWDTWIDNVRSMLGLPTE